MRSALNWIFSHVPERSARRLWLCGGGMLAPVLYFAWRYPLRGNTHRLADIGTLSRYGRDEFALFLGGIVLLVVLYVLALRETRRLPARRALPAVFSCGTALAAGMAHMYPVNAIDIFIYSAHSRLFTTYGANPIATFAKDYPADPWLQYASRQWAAYESPYGPLWSLIAAPITALAGDQIAVALIGFKLLALVSLVGGSWVIARVLLRTRSAPAATGALFYLWNPLVLWEAVGNGHNDVVMTLPVLLALLAWATRRDVLVIPLLLVAALIKYVPVVLIPLAAVALWRRAESPAARRHLAAGTIMVCVLVGALGLYPFYDLRAIQSSMAHHSAIFRLSPAAIALDLFRGRFPANEIRRWSTLAGITGVVLALVWQSIILWKRPSRLPRAMFEVVFVFLLVARWNFTAWYLIWPVGLAALVCVGWPAWRMIGWTTSALASYGLFIWLEAWWHPKPATLHMAGVITLIGAAVLLTLAELASRTFLPWLRRRSASLVHRAGRSERLRSG